MIIMMIYIKIIYLRISFCHLCEGDSRSSVDHCNLAYLFLYLRLILLKFPNIRTTCIYMCMYICIYISCGRLVFWIGSKGVGRIILAYSHIRVFFLFGWKFWYVQFWGIHINNCWSLWNWMAFLRKQWHHRTSNRKHNDSFVQLLPNPW